MSALLVPAFARPPVVRDLWQLGETMPDKSWSALLRLYGPLEPWFDKSWKPGDFERVDA